MNQPKKRRRLILPLLLSTGLLATAAAGAWHRGRSATLDAERVADAAPAGNALDAVAEAWAAESTPSPPTAPVGAIEDPLVVPASAEASLADAPAPFVPVAAEPLAGRYAQQASYEAPPADDPEEDAGAVARGQSPQRLSASAIPTTGNPLRGQRQAGPPPRYDSVTNDEASRAFGRVLAAGAEDEAAAPRIAELDDSQAATDFGEGPATPPAPARRAVAAVAADDIPDPFAADPFEADATTPPAAPPIIEPSPIAPLDSEVRAAFDESADAAPPEQLLQATEPPPARPLRSVVKERTTVAPPSDFAPFDGASPMTPQRLASASPTGRPVGAAALGAGRPGERAMEGHQQPSLAIQKFAPEEVQVGKPAKFVIKVRNTSQRPAVGVVVRDQAPAGTRLMGTNPRAETIGGEIVWDLGTMSAGEERELEMELTPTEEGEIGSIATVSFSAHASAKTVSTRPQLVVRMSAADQVLVGRRQRVQIELSNPGTGDATNVVLLENVPENLRHDAGAALEFEIGVLPAGETRTLELVMNAERPGHVVNTLVARADGNLEVEQRVEFDVVAPDLAVGVQGPRRRYLEHPATYTVSIGNPGTAPARDVRLVTKLPQGMRFVKANNLGEYDAATHSVYWSLAELPEGERGEVTLTALPVTSGDLTLEVAGQASEGLLDEAAMEIQIEGIAALKFEVLDLEDPIEVGGETVYEVRVANQGTKASTNVGVRLVLPEGMEAVAASGETRHRVEAGAVVFSPLERLAPQAESLFRVRVVGRQAGDQRLMVEVSSDDLTQPVRKEESTRVFGDE